MANEVIENYCHVIRCLTLGRSYSFVSRKGGEGEGGILSGKHSWTGNKDGGTRLHQFLFILPIFREFYIVCN